MLATASMAAGSRRWSRTTGAAGRRSRLREARMRARAGRSRTGGRRRAGGPGTSGLTTQEGWLGSGRRWPAPWLGGRWPARWPGVAPCGQRPCPTTGSPGSRRRSRAARRSRPSEFAAAAASWSGGTSTATSRSPSRSGTAAGLGVDAEPRSWSVAGRVGPDRRRSAGAGIDRRGATARPSRRSAVPDRRLRRPQVAVGRPGQRV